MIRLFYAMTIILIIGCETGKPQEQNLKGEISVSPESDFVSDSTTKLVTDTLFYPAKILISYPESWIKLDMQEQGLLLAAKMNCDTSILFCPNFTITIAKKRPPMTLDDYGKGIVQAQTGYMDEVETINISKGIIDNREVEYLILEQKFLSNSIKLGGITKVFNIRDTYHILTISLMAERGEEDEYVSKENQQLFYQILDSMTFWL